jgi:hypothetical protein
VKRINPTTNKPFKYKDTREDGFVFCNYIKTKIGKNGFFLEQWLSPKTFIKQNVLHKKASAKWDKKYPEKACAKSAKRHTIKLKRTPSWDPNAQLIIAKYQLAAMLTKASGILHHVDHIIPLQGKNVSGLHVFSNLTVIPALDNIKKSNKFYI